MSSYVLDRELLLNTLGSARNSTCQHQHQTITTTSTQNWIDANSNSALLGTTVYQRNTDAEMRKQMADV
jgi:hypothetical protein